VTVRIVIAHAPWAEGREASLQYMLDRLEGVEAVVFSSPKREHAFVWAQRIWRWCAHQDAHDDPADWLILNDDLETHPKLLTAVEACVEAVGRDRVLCFHTNAPMAPDLARVGQRWLESYWCTGPAYLLPTGIPARLLAFLEFQGAALWGGNEDAAMMEWMWSERLPAWHSLPALVQHRVEVPSTLGYDGHPMRQSLVPWSDEDVTRPGFWRIPYRPLHIECPWMPEAKLLEREQTRAVMQTSGQIGASE
jgi:hypothetical protein